MNMRGIQAANSEIFAQQLTDELRQLLPRQAGA